MLPLFLTQPIQGDKSCCQKQNQTESKPARLDRSGLRTEQNWKEHRCSHAENALFLATEPGLNALEVFEAPITCWDDLLQACAEIAEGKHDFKTIVIDTVDNAYRMCADYVCKSSRSSMNPTLATARLCPHQQ